MTGAAPTPPQHEGDPTNRKKDLMSTPLTVEQVDAWRKARQTPEHWLSRVTRQARLVNRLHEAGRPADLLGSAERVFQMTVRRAFATGATLDDVAVAAGLAVAR